MTRLAYSALLLAMTIAAGCAATADAGSSEEDVHLGTPPDAGTDAAPASDAGPAVVDTDAGAAAPSDTDAAAPTGPRGPSATTFTAKLAAIGLDVNNLPALHDLPTAQKLKVMRTFNESMGITCTNCHDASDYAKMTPQKEIAAAGWEDISRKVTMADGAPIYCDSCHYGKFDFLDRTSGFAGIQSWMKTNFVETLKTKAGDAMACSTCHGSTPVDQPGYGDSTH